MSDLERALSDIANIRNQVAEANLFRGFGPMVIGLTGILALLLASVQSLSPQHAVLGNWIVLAGLCAGLIGCEMWALSKRAHGGVASSFLWSIIEKFLPALIAGASIAWVILSNSPETSWILPGIWQILIAMGLFAARSMLPKLLSFVAGWYFLCGFVVLLLASNQGQISPWSMGIPFGIGQMMMAAALKFAPEKTKDFPL